MLSHLLHQEGVASIVLEKRDREYIENRTRAGLLEFPTVELLRERGLGQRMLEQGTPHRGTEIRFQGERHRIPYSDLYGGRAMLVYAQQQLVADLVKLRLEAGCPIVFEAEDVRPRDIDSSAPAVGYRTADGAFEIECDFIAGCDGFHGVCRDPRSRPAC